MNKPVKELIAKSEDERLEVFVRTSPQELSMGDIELVAGGARAMIVPNG